ncbi:helix-turn-helix transcriptional regulator [bacterium]|nr:helix-turn-helix transcriptional regulator [bacterium]
MSIKEQFGKRLRELRTGKNITQEKLSEAIGIQPENYSRIENGLSFPKPENIEKIALILGVDTKELFEFDHFSDFNLIKERLTKKLTSDEDTARLIYKFLKSIGKL